MRSRSVPESSKDPNSRPVDSCARRRAISNLLRNFQSIWRTRRRALLPIDRDCLELQAHGEVPIGKPLTINNPGKRAKIAHDRAANHEPLI